MKKLIEFSCLVIFLLCQTCNASEKLLIQYTPLDGPNDKSMDFMLSILNLGFAKTKDHYGDFEIKPIPLAQLPFKRVIRALRDNSYPNILFPETSVNILNTAMNY